MSWVLNELVSKESSHEHSLHFAPPPPPPPPPPRSLNSTDLPQFARLLLGQNLVVVIAVLALGLLSAQVAHAATINVNSTCRFDSAINSANQDSSVGGCTAGSGADTINITDSIAFVSNAPAISSEITINGNGYTFNGRDKSRFVSLVSGADLTLNNITLTRFSAGSDINCSSHGAVVDGDYGKLTITNSTIKSNWGGEGCGSNRDSGWGAINFAGDELTVTNSTFDGNGSHLKGTSTGLALTYDGFGTLTITGSTFKNHRDWYDGGEAYGGAVFVGNTSATVTVTNSTFENNFANNGGGALALNTASSVTITNSTFKNNKSDLGGAIVFYDDFNGTITGSTFSGNTGDVGGGAISIYGDYESTVVTGTLTISNSKFVGNKAPNNKNGEGGAIEIGVSSGNSITVTITGSEFSKNSAGYRGGAMRNSAGSTVTMISSFVANGSAGSGPGGAIANFGNLTLNNVTVYNNRAPFGAGILNAGSDAELTFNHVTLSRNRATSGTVAGSAALISWDSATVNLNNSIVAENYDANGKDSDCWRSTDTTKSYQSNLIGKTTMDNSCVSTENFSGNPFLGFFDEGHLPLNSSRSAAIGEGTDSVCAAHSKDQRGKDRLTADCDLGAVEYYSPDYSPPDSCTDITFPVNGTTTVTGTISQANTTQTAYYCFTHTGSASKNITILLEDNDWSKKVDKELRLLDKQGAPYSGISSHTYDDDTTGPTLINQVAANYAGKHYIAVDASPYLGNFKYTLTLGFGVLDAWNSSGSFSVDAVSCNIGTGFYYATLNKGSLGALSTFDLDLYGIGTGQFDMTFGHDDSIIGNLKHHFSADGVKNEIITNIIEKPLHIAAHHKGSVASAVKAFKAKLLAKYTALSSLKAAGALTIKGGLGVVGGVGVTSVVVKAGLVYVGAAVPLALVDYLGSEVNKGKYEGKLLKHARQDVHGWHNTLSGLLGGSGKVPDDFFGLMVGGSKRGAIVAITKKKNNPLSTPVYTRTVICAMGATPADGGDDDSPSDTSSKSSAASKSSLTTGQQLNADDTDGVNVASLHGLTSGIEFQRRGQNSVATITSPNIQQVVAAGIVDIIEVWSFAQQPAEICFDDFKVGSNGGIMFIDKSALQPMVNLAPATTRKGSQTCIGTNGPGYVVLVANMPPGSPAPAVPVTPTPEPQVLTDCMTTTNVMLNLRASPGGEVIAILPFNVTLTTTKLADGWFEVDFHGTHGWVSAGWVTTSGSCGGESAAPSENASSAPASYAPVVTTQPANADGTQSHVVQPGDTLLGIAVAYGLSLDDILQRNQISNPSYIQAGRTLSIK